MPRVSSSTSARWADSVPAGARSRAPWADATRRDRPTAVPFGQARECAGLAQVPWGITLARDAAAAIPWIAGQRLDGTPATVVWGLSAIADAGQQIDAKTSAAIPLRRATLVLWGLSARADIGGRMEGTGGFGAHPAQGAISTAWGKQRPADTLGWVPWGMGRIVDAGTVVIVEPGDPSEPDSTLIIPTLRAYIVINSASLSRVSNNLALPAFGLSMSIDDRSAHWTWSASLPLAALADIEPDAPGQLVELEAVVNGCVFRLFIQSVREREAFLGSGLAIGGRGLAAELSAPNYPVSAHNNIGGAMTAQQLAAEALSINGVPLGWSLDWQAADWLVPAGVWLHSGTPLDAVVTLAAAAGAYVQADPAARALHVLPRYPVAPWDWSTATPAVVLPASAVLDRGTEHVIGAGYNVVYVSGQEHGIRARVKRIGTAGDVPAEMIVDRLITHADPARARGVEVLGQGGSRQVTTLETGVLPESGLLHVGTLMDWTRNGVARRSLVRSLSVSVSVPGGQSRDPIKVRQTVEVETRG